MRRALGADPPCGAAVPTPSPAPGEWGEAQILLPATSGGRQWKAWGIVPSGVDGIEPERQEAIAPEIPEEGFLLASRQVQAQEIRGPLSALFT